ncbi:MAG: phosphate ABC transporter permease PstA [Pseudomonadota bacterium]
MTDLTAPGSASHGELHTSREAKKRLAARYRSEANFRNLGIFAVLLAMAFLVILLYTIVSKGYHAFTYHYLTVSVNLEQSEIDPEGTGDPEVIGRADYNSILRSALGETLPFAEGRRDRRVRNRLVTNVAGINLRNAVLADPGLIGTVAKVPVQLDDFGDLYMKGLVTEREDLATNGIGSANGTTGSVTVLSSANDFRDILSAVEVHIEGEITALRNRIAANTRSVRRQTVAIEDMTKEMANATEARRAVLEDRISSSRNSINSVNLAIQSDETKIAEFEQRLATPGDAEPLEDTMPSFLIAINGGVIKVTEVSNAGIVGAVLVPLESTDDAEPGAWTIAVVEQPQANRKLSDKELVWLDYLQDQGLIERKLNSVFFTAGASREPEQAGILGAVMGSFFTMLVTLLLSFPIGVGAAIYLEEFAPRNKVTELIEVNINNLAAVPSIVFGLLGLAMFLNVFGMPRSAPLVGGMVLALMTLPTIIIASRAALRSVPPSIREAALGIGASRLQAVTHHVLPLAMPGILTGTIIGMAQALGETAPLLMIGMVAFIVDIPSGPFDPATVLPVQIFMWADFPEPAFQQKTSAAIMILLAFLVTMNALAVVLRKRFERRW